MLNDWQINILILILILNAKIKNRLAHECRINCFMFRVLATDDQDLDPCASYIKYSNKSCLNTKGNFSIEIKIQVGQSN